MSEAHNKTPDQADPFIREVEELYEKLARAEVIGFKELAAIAGIDLEDKDSKSWLSSNLSQEELDEAGLSDPLD